MADINFSEFMAETKKDTKSIEMPDGSLIELPPIELLPDAFFEAAKSDNHIEMAKALLGPDDYAKWTSYGANAVTLMSVFAKLHGVTLPNSPTS